MNQQSAATAAMYQTTTADTYIHTHHSYLTAVVSAFLSQIRKLATFAVLHCRVNVSSSTSCYMKREIYNRVFNVFKMNYASQFLR